MKKNPSFSHEIVSAEEARKIFQDQPLKLELIADLEKSGEAIGIERTGDGFIDLCKGEHISRAGEIPSDAFHLTKIAGAYWKGNEENTMLTRIYGVAFSKEEELKQYLAMLEEAEKRDHKKLGIELDLFAFSPLVGSGLPLFTPRGRLYVKNLLISFSPCRFPGVINA